MSLDREQPGTVESIYRLEAGFALAADRSIYTPGRFQGEPITLPCNAYLIRRAGEWTLWDTGMPDELALEPEGRIIAHGLRGILPRTLRSQLQEIGVVPDDIGTVILSHGHFDHVGNAALFRHATWVLQSAEFDAMVGPDAARHGYRPELYEGLRDARLLLLDGDRDLFSDGSVSVIATPGHTPGHASLLVRTQGGRAIVLSGDVAHSSFNLEHRYVPTMNADAEASRRSMERIVDLVREEDAELWINHDPGHATAVPAGRAIFGW
ncbi:N-acyl homoserine lactonase family protein [Chthonobacter rhizosphaerae]|uniref:N-acyl homoserine lactonase family protein n=1 Tax=Chthonobacter rhizosphaerae TaxID=2735553 RepID=UPI0015EF31FB|nr:N-acyl homoserine lactonase family protein [Chthonobacter rhizosphaerae]